MQNEIKIPKFIFDNLLGSVVHVIVYIQILTLNRMPIHINTIIGSLKRSSNTWFATCSYLNIKIKFIIVFTYFMISFFIFEITVFIY